MWLSCLFWIMNIGIKVVEFTLFCCITTTIVFISSLGTKEPSRVKSQSSEAHLVEKQRQITKEVVQAAYMLFSFRYSVCVGKWLSVHTPKPSMRSSNVKTESLLQILIHFCQFLSSGMDIWQIWCLKPATMFYYVARNLW